MVIRKTPFMKFEIEKQEQRARRSTALIAKKGAKNANASANANDSDT